MLNSLKNRLCCVRGNCDAEVDQMVLDFPCLGDYALVVDADTTLMLTHGHLDLSRVVAGLPAGSFVLSGHTHVKGIGPEVAPAFVKDAGAAESGSKEGAAEACPRCPHSPQSPSSTPAVSATPKTVPPATPSGTMAPWSCARSLVEKG